MIDAREGGPSPIPDISFSSGPFGVRLFVCPGCGVSRRRLYEVDDVWRCRVCHRLDYASRHSRTALPGHARVLMLRRRVSAEPVLFGKLPMLASHTLRQRAIVAEIRRLEAELVRVLRRRRIGVLQLPRTPRYPWET